MVFLLGVEVNSPLDSHLVTLLLNLCAEDVLDGLPASQSSRERSAGMQLGDYLGRMEVVH